MTADRSLHDPFTSVSVVKALFLGDTTALIENDGSRGKGNSGLLPRAIAGAVASMTESELEGTE